METHLMLKHNCYRNDKMRDVDFYVTNVTDTQVIGFWISRSTRNVINRAPDRLEKSRIVVADWKDVGVEHLDVSN